MNVNKQKTGQRLPREGQEGGITKTGGNIWGNDCVHYHDQGEFHKYRCMSNASNCTH